MIQKSEFIRAWSLVRTNAVGLLQAAEKPGRDHNSQQVFDSQLSSCFAAPAWQYATQHEL
jgi:hypothetical protein